MQEVSSLERERVEKEFNEAIANLDNIKLVASIKQKYRNIPKDERDRCGLIAIWKTVKKHQKGRQKFTSSLYKYMNWECQKWLRDNKPTKTKPPVINKENNILNECVNMSEDGEFVRLFYLQDKTYKEISDIYDINEKQAEEKVSNGLNKLKTILEKNHAWEIYCE